MISIESLDPLSLRDLRALLTLAELRHFGRAAQQCGMTQPSLSAIVKKAEGILRAPLFIRTPRSVEISQEGQVAFPIIEEAFRGLERLTHIRQSSISRLVGALRLGIIPTLGPYLLPHCMPALKERFPKLELVLVEARTQSLIKMLQSRRIDAALVSLPLDEPYLSEIPLFQEELALALPVEHPLAKRKSVGVADIDQREIILLEDGHCLREDVLRQCNPRNEASKSGHAASLEVQRYMVQAGSGCAVFPALAVNWSAFPSPLIRYVPFNHPSPSRTVGLVSPRTSVRGDDIGALAECLRNLPMPTTVQRPA